MEEPPVPPPLPPPPVQTAGVAADGGGDPARGSKRKWDVVGPGYVPPADPASWLPPQPTGDGTSPSFAAALAAAVAATPAWTNPAAAPAAAGIGAPAFAQASAGSGALAFAAAPPLAAGVATSLPGAQRQPLDRYVRLRGLPFSAGEAEIFAFLTGLEVEGVRLCIGPNGRHTGEGLVALSSVEMAASALERDRTYMGHRYVEVYPAMADEYLALPEQVSGPSVAQSLTGSVLRMRGLPFSASMQDILHFWVGFGVLRVAQVPLGPDGRPSGEAYAEFASTDEAARALTAKQHGLMGMRYVELYPASPEEMHLRAGEGRAAQALWQEAPPALATPAAANGCPAAGGGCLAADPAAQQTPVMRLRGLPYQATAGDIARFFHGFSLARILPATAPVHGRPSGEGYVEFTSVAECSRALRERQHGLLGQRYIELFLAPLHEMAQAAQGQGTVEVGSDGSVVEAPGGGEAWRPLHGKGGHWEGQSRHALPPPRPGGDPCTALRMRGLPYQATVEDIISFFAGCGVARVLPIVAPPTSRPTGEAFVEFATAEQCDVALTSHQHGHIGSRYIELFPAALAEMRASVGARQITEVGPDGAASLPAGGSPRQQAAGPVLMMRGLPFNATTDDISTFFSGFTVAKVVAVVPEDGRPNKGEAYVEFPSAEDCSRALGECQHKFVGSRYIELFPASLEDMRWAAARAAEAERWYASSGRYADSAGRHGSWRGSGDVGGPALRMRGLPFDATAEDIAYFFEGFNLKRILPGITSFNGRPTGEAYVEFATPEDAASARSVKHRGMMGQRWIELYCTTVEEMAAAAGGRELLDANVVLAGSGVPMAATTAYPAWEGQAAKHLGTRPTSVLR